MNGIIEGRVVHYVAYNGRCLAGMIIGTKKDNEDYKEDDVDLVVFTNMKNSAGNKNFGVQFHQEVEYRTDSKAGSWHWPERE